MTAKTKTPRTSIILEEEVYLPSTETTVEEDAVLPFAQGNVVDLPSNGKLGYPAFAEYREIMVRDEEVLSSATSETYVKTLNAVVKSVMNDCPFYEDMALADRDFMLIWLWAQNYSSSKNVEITCGSCETKTVHKVDLRTLPQKPFPESYKPNFQIPIKKTGGFITVRYNTVRDELVAAEYMRRTKDTVKFENVMLSQSIDLGMPVSADVKLKWVMDNMTAKEMATVRKFHNHFEFGIDASISHVCPACGEVTRGQVPFQATDVLFPTVSDDFEELLRSN